MLDIVPMRQCLSNEHVEVKAQGSKGDVYTCTFGPTNHGPVQYDWTCDCKGFKFRKKCKHVIDAERDRCGWHQQFDGGRSMMGYCPRCGNETQIVMVGV